MAKRMPSLLALLGLVAVAGYQNREKIGEFVKGLSNDPNGPAGGMIDMAKKAIGNSPTATSITGGLGELVEQFTSRPPSPRWGEEEPSLQLRLFSPAGRRKANVILMPRKPTATGCRSSCRASAPPRAEHSGR